MITARIKPALHALFRAVDILLCTLWLAPLYIVGLAARPSGRMLISSYVGEAAAGGTRWAITAAAVIDWLAELFGQAPGHCQRTFLFYRDLDD